VLDCKNKEFKNILKAAVKQNTRKRKDGLATNNKNYYLFASAGLPAVGGASAPRSRLFDSFSPLSASTTGIGEEEEVGIDFIFTLVGAAPDDDLRDVIVKFKIDGFLHTDASANNPRFKLLWRDDDIPWGYLCALSLQFSSASLVGQMQILGWEHSQ
jgi:hypothetical protein